MDKHTDQKATDQPAADQQTAGETGSGEDQELELYVPVMILPVSAGRHYAAVVLLAVLGFISLSIVLKTPPSALGAVALTLLGAFMLYMSYLVWTVGARSLHLTADELRDDTGRLLCLVKDIRSVERGALAFKPSNGFVIALKSGVQRGWAPGLWWAFGKQVGVGGVTSAGAGKAMGDVLAARVASLAAQRDAEALGAEAVGTETLDSDR